MSNAYESGAQKVIPAVLLYAFYEGQVLMLHARSKDGMSGKWNGLGGKLEPGETLLKAAAREFEEEASCKTLEAEWQWNGQLYFPNFKAHKKEDWWVTVLTIELSKAQKNQIPLLDETQPEGLLQFLPTAEALRLDLWEGDRHFLPFVFKKIPFEGTFFYESGKCTHHHLKPIVPSSNHSI